MLYICITYKGSRSHILYHNLWKLRWPRTLVTDIQNFNYIHRWCAYFIYLSISFPLIFFCKWDANVLIHHQINKYFRIGRSSTWGIHRLIRIIIFILSENGRYRFWKSRKNVHMFEFTTIYSSLGCVNELEFWNASITKMQSGLVFNISSPGIE